MRASLLATAATTTLSGFVTLTRRDPPDLGDQRMSCSRRRLRAGSERIKSKLLVVGSAEKVTLVVEGVVGRGVDAQEALRRANRFDAFASSDGQVGVLSAVVGFHALIMNAGQAETATCRPV